MNKNNWVIEVLKKTSVLVLLTVISACASQPDDIGTAHVSEIQFQNHSCDQLRQELTRVSRRVSELHGSLKKTADNDAAQMGIGLILFWPTLFFLEGGDGPQAQEYARLKGEREAIERASIKKKCTL